MKEQNVFIIGSKGIPAKYGGFETFVENLTARKIDKNVKYHVSCMGKNNEEFEYNNARCFNINVPEIGAAKAVYYDIMSLKNCIKYIKKNNIKNGIVYILACRIGPFIGHYKKKLSKLGIKLYVNPDGHEWKRAKWNCIIKKYWKFSEKLMVKHADLLICDSINIEKYIKESYKRYNPNTIYIAYGSDTKKSKLQDNDEQLLNWYKEKNIKSNEYYLVVGRFVPENNYETMITEYMKSKSKKDLVLITNICRCKFYETLKEKTHFEEDNRIKFVGTVYDQELLKKIRENAYGYIHGHEVGGTNPSLLEALATTQLNLLLDVGFNKEVGQDGAEYWNKSEGSLSSLLEKMDNILEDDLKEYEERAKKRIHEEYSWNKIIEQYEETFQKKNILIVSNMYPSEKYPHYGVFVKNVEKILNNRFSVQKSVMDKKDSRLDKIIGYFKFYLNTIYLARKHTYDIIYGHYVSHTAIPLIIIKKLRKNCKIITNVHGNDIIPECKKDKHFLKFSRKVMNISDKIIAPSNYFKNILIEKYNINKNKIYVYASGGVNTDIFKPIDKTEARKKMNLDIDYKYVGYVSRIETKKGWDVLLKAIKILDSKLDKNVKFIFVGNGTEKEKLNNLILELGISDRVILENFKTQAELAYIYNSFDVFCFPTYRESESLGLVGLEAMSCGTIVIASDIGGIKEYLKDKENGYTFQIKNEKELAEKIFLLLNINEEEKKKISNSAIITGRKYSKDKIKEDIIEAME